MRFRATLQMADGWVLNLFETKDRDEALRVCKQLNNVPHIKGAPRPLALEYKAVVEVIPRDEDE